MHVTIWSFKVNDKPSDNISSGTRVQSLSG